MRVMTIQSDFTGGELDPKLYGRVSIPRYQSGLQTAKNVDIMVTGGATRRAGTKFVYSAGPAASTTVRQIPFVIFRTDTTPASLKGYVVEFRSDNKLRFYVDGALILTGGSTPYEIVSPFTSADLSLIKYEQFNSGLYLVHPDFPPQKLTRVSDTSWTIAAMNFTFNTPEAQFGSFFTERVNPKGVELRGVEWSGSQFVAVGAADGTDAYILTSPDGVTWTERSNPKNVQLNAVVWSGNQFVAVGNSDGADSYILTSPDGITWTERAPTVSKTVALNSIAWSGALLVAVGNGDGTDAYILTSTDGITWTERAPSVAKNVALFGVTWSGAQFVAVGAGDGTDAYILTSLNGFTWAERAPTVAKNIALYSVCYYGALFVAVGDADGTDAYILTSPDGFTWTEQGNPKNVTLYSVVWAGSQFIAVGYRDGIDTYILTSPDGFTWTERKNPKQLPLYGMCWSGTQLVAVGLAFIILGVDINTWIEQGNPKNVQLSSVVWSGTRFVAVGAADGTDSYILTSPDGVVWTERAPTISRNVALNSIAILTNGNYMAVGNVFGASAYAVISTDGISWTERTNNPKALPLNGVAHMPGTPYVVAVGAADADAYIITTIDGGLNWVERGNPKNAGLNAIAHNGGTLYVAVGNADGTDAYIATSPTGTSWTERSNPKNVQLNAVVWAGNQFVAVGAGDGVDSYILTSPDGITWTEQAPTVPKNLALYGVTWSGSQFVATGAADASTDAYILTSPDGITWTERSNPKNFQLNSVCWDGSNFLAVGNADGTDAYIIATGQLSDGDTDAYMLTSSLPTTIEGLTFSGGTVTGSTTAKHNLKTGQIVTIAGATQTEYNGTFQVTVVDDYIFTYTITGTPASPATGTITWARVPWGTTGYPSAITFFEQRMILARTKTHPQTIWGSETNNLLNFVLGVLDSSPFEFVPSAAAASINQLLATTQVLALTNDKEIVMSGGSGLPLTPSNVQIKAVGRYGSKDGIRPLPIGGEVLFATRGAQRVRAMAYKLIEDSYKFPNIAIMAEHLLDAGILELWQASEPESAVYVLTTDGKIARIAYDRDQEVVAFSRYETDGLFRGMAVVQEGLTDQIYVTVERTINGTAYLYTELFDPDLNTDCAFTGYDAAGKTTWAGLNHLEGKLVDIVADGAALTPRTVTAGQVTLPLAVDSVEIGLHYDSELQDLRPEVPSQDGTAQGRTSVSVNEITVRLENSRGCVINGESVPDTGTPFRGDKKVSNLGWGGESGRVQVKQTKPLPFTVLAIIKRVTVND